MSEVDSTGMALPPVAMTVPRYVSTSARVVTVEVGFQAQRFVVHKDIIVRSSTFFRDKIAEQSHENTESITISLTRDDPEVFADYLRAVYEDTMDFNHERVNFSSLAELYVLAEELGDARTANIIMDKIIPIHSETGTLPTSGEVTEVYNLTYDFSLLHQLMADYHVHEGNGGSEGVTDSDEFPVEFQLDCLAEFQRARATVRKLKNPLKKVLYKGYVGSQKACEYHQHDDNHPKSDCSAS